MNWPAHQQRQTKAHTVAGSAAYKPRRRPAGGCWATERPTWLSNAHWRLDEAVFAAYGWPADLIDDETRRVARPALNWERAASLTAGPVMSS